MNQEFIGIDPETGQSGSPIVWVNPETRDVVMQGYKADEVTLEECAQNAAPGHAPGIPKQCVDAFEAVWDRAVPHDQYTLL